MPSNMLMPLLVFLDAWLCTTSISTWRSGTSSAHVPQRQLSRQSREHVTLSVDTSTRCDQIQIAEPIIKLSHD